MKYGGLEAGHTTLVHILYVLCRPPGRTIGGLSEGRGPMQQKVGTIGPSRTRARAHTADTVPNLMRCCSRSYTIKTWWGEGDG